MLTKSLSMKKRLRAGELTLGAWLTFYDTAVAEIMANVGFDWLLIDAEHAPFNPESLASILMAFDGRRPVSIVRVPWNDPVTIKQVLDMGAGGILIPYVCSVQEAEQAVAACKYPPQGIRGFGPRRASNYGHQIKEYIQLANEAIIVAVQIEHIKAVKQVEAILAVPGIDVVLLGPMDLSASLGLLGQLEHPLVVEAMERVVAAAQQAQLPVGIPLSADASMETILHWASKGCRFVIVGLDQGFIQQAATQNLAQFRQSLAGESEQ